MEEPSILFGDPRVIDDAIRGVAHRWHLDPAKAAEWRQVAWLMLLERASALRKQYRCASSVRTFLGAVLNHWCADWLEREARSRTISHAIEDVRAAKDRVSGRAFSDWLIDIERRSCREVQFRELHLAWQHLDARDQQIVIAYLDGDKLTRRELADALDLTPEALRQRFHRVLARLRQLMNIGRSVWTV